MRNKVLKIPLIIILGTMAFLARTVIPHHHHGPFTCFATAHRQPCACLPSGSLSFDDLQNESESTGSHGNDKGQQGDNCFLELEVTVPEINEKIQIGTFGNITPDQLLNSDYNSLTGEGLLYINQNRPGFLVFERGFGKYHLRDSYPASGLRAPPAA